MRSRHARAVRAFLAIPLVLSPPLEGLAASSPSNAAFDSTYNEGSLLVEQQLPRAALSTYLDALDYAETNRQKVKALGAVAAIQQTLCEFDEATKTIDAILELENSNVWARAKKKELATSVSTKNGCHLPDFKGKDPPLLVPWTDTDRKAVELLEKIPTLFTSPMTFHWVTPCDGRSHELCAPYVLGIGDIAASTPEEFSRFVDQHPAHRISFHSRGGNLFAGLKLGKLLHEKGWGTMVGEKYSTTVESLLRLAPKNIRPGQLPDQFLQLTLIRNPVCLSACAYAFLGGHERTVSEKASYGVHQFRSTGTGADEMTTQTLVALIGAYLVDLDINRDLLQLALWAKPDQMWVLSRAELDALDVVTQKDAPVSRWRLEALEDGQLVAMATNRDGTLTNRIVSIAVSRNGNSFAGFLGTRLQFKSTADKDRIVSCADSQTAEPRCVLLKASGRDYWLPCRYTAASKGSLQVTFDIPKEIVLALARGEKLEATVAMFGHCRDAAIYFAAPDDEQTNTFRALLR
jgi:hypothetical protein